MESLHASPSVYPLYMPVRMPIGLLISTQPQQLQVGIAAPIDFNFPGPLAQGTALSIPSLNTIQVIVPGCNQPEILVFPRTELVVRLDVFWGGLQTTEEVAWVQLAQASVVVLDGQTNFGNSTLMNQDAALFGLISQLVSQSSQGFPPHCGLGHTPADFHPVQNAPSSFSMTSPTYIAGPFDPPLSPQQQQAPFPVLEPSEPVAEDFNFLADLEYDAPGGVIDNAYPPFDPSLFADLM